MFATQLLVVPQGGGGLSWQIKAHATIHKGGMLCCVNHDYLKIKQMSLRHGNCTACPDDHSASVSYRLMSRLLGIYSFILTDHQNEQRILFVHFTIQSHRYVHTPHRW